MTTIFGICQSCMLLPCDPSQVTHFQRFASCWSRSKINSSLPPLLSLPLSPPSLPPIVTYWQWAVCFIEDITYSKHNLWVWNCMPRALYWSPFREWAHWSTTCMPATSWPCNTGMGILPFVPRPFILWDTVTGLNYSSLARTPPPPPPQTFANISLPSLPPSHCHLLTVSCLLHWEHNLQ